MLPMSSITLPIFLLLALAFCSSQFLAEFIKRPSSQILGLTHSRNAFPTKSSSALDTAKMQSGSTFDMVEPLKEVRDGYLMSLNLGTPPQVIQVYMDTGSDLTWAPCGNLSFDCLECDHYYRDNKLVGAFSPFSSSSTLRDLCTSPFCTRIHNSDNPYDPCVMAGCSLGNLLKGTCLRPCPSFAYTYGEGGIVIGALTKDVVRVHGSSPNDIREVQNFRFGCVRSSYREPLGIAGFGRGPLSLPSQLGFLEKGFSHCFVSFKFASNPNVSSSLIIGDMAISSKESSQFTPLLTNPQYPNYYYIGLEAITVGNMSMKEVPMNLKAFDAKGNGGMMIDSGTTYTHLPEPFYSQLLSDLQMVIPYPRATEQETETGFDLCYKIPCPSNNASNCMEIEDELPSITLHFMDNVSLVLPKANNFYAVGPPSYFTLVECLLYQGMEDGDDGGPAAVFGSFQQQNVEVVYDLEKLRIGFKHMDCAALAASQGLHQS